MKKVLTILFMLCLFAPSAYRLAAYTHCKIAETLATKDCGCDTIITNHIPAENHAAPALKVHNAFADWQFEQTINCAHYPIIPATIKDLFVATQGFPQTFPQEIFHPPSLLNII